jgi:hypothetical protein
MLKRLTTALAVVFTLQAWTLPAQAVDPRIEWQTIETPHFSIVFDSRHYPLAARYATFAEQSFAAISPVFGAWPEKTTIVIDDSTDLANGFAVGVPYPLISSYPVLPTALDSISDYGNWGLELLTHEYAHVLTFEPARGWMRPLRAVFGNIIRPNMLLPRWYLEGLAVEMETRFSSFGRLRSPNYLAIPRAMVEDGSLRNEDIARINETSIPDWPGGIRPYLMGAMLWSEMTLLGGDKAVGELNDAYSRRIPYFINGPVEDKFGLDFDQLLSKVYDRAEAGARQQIETIKGAGSVAETKLEQEGYFSHSPAISPDGRYLAWIGRVHNSESIVALRERAAEASTWGPATRLFDSTGTNRVSWLPNSSGFVYDAVDTVERYSQYADLWLFDVASKKKTQLSYGLRAREPVVSPDGRTVIFVQNTPGSTVLASAPLDGPAPGGDHRHPGPTQSTVLYTPPLQTRVARPEFLSPTELVFTEKRDDGAERLHVLTLARDASGGLQAKGAPRPILTEFNPTHFPRMTSEGLFFVSDRSGVANLYLASKNLKSARAVTNTTTRVMTGELDSRTGDLLYARLTSEGPQLYASERAAWTKAPAAPPQVASFVDNQWPSYTPPTVEVTTETKPYSPWSYLWPRYWMPYAYVMPEGGYFSASVSSNDPLGKHAYAVDLFTDTLTNKPSFSVQYLNKTTPVDLLFTGQDIYEYITSADIVRRTTAGGVFGSFYLPGLSEKWHGGVGWQSLRSELEQDSLTRNGAQVSISYNNASQKGLQISPESGGGFSLAQTHFFPELGTLGYDQTDAHGAYYFSRGLPKRHALAGFVNATLAPNLTRALLGRTTVAGASQTNLIQNAFVMRGYGSGVFLGKNLVSATLEYRFPLSYRYQGWGTSPFFVQRYHGAIFADALTLDGFAYDYAGKGYRSAKLGSFFYGTGAELKADATVFYHVNVQLMLGLYYGTDSRSNPNGLFPFIGIGI